MLGNLYFGGKKLFFFIGFKSKDYKKYGFQRKEEYSSDKYSVRVQPF